MPLIEVKVLEDELGQEQSKDRINKITAERHGRTPKPTDDDRTQQSHLKYRDAIVTKHTLPVRSKALRYLIASAVKKTDHRSLILNEV